MLGLVIIGIGFGYVTDIGSSWCTSIVILLDKMICQKTQKLKLCVNPKYRHIWYVPDSLCMIIVRFLICQKFLAWSAQCLIEKWVSHMYLVIIIMFIMTYLFVLWLVQDDFGIWHIGLSNKAGTTFRGAHCKTSCKSSNNVCVSLSKRFLQELKVNFPLCLNILLEFTKTDTASCMLQNEYQGWQALDKVW